MVNIKNFFVKQEKRHRNILPEGVPILRVVTREEPPYVMKCLNCSSLSGNHSVAYQGFAIDLLDAISKVKKYSRRSVTSLFLNMMLPSRLLASTTPSTWFPTIFTGCSTTRPRSGMASSGKKCQNKLSQSLSDGRRRYWTKVYLTKERNTKL